MAALAGRATTPVSARVVPSSSARRCASGVAGEALFCVCGAELTRADCAWATTRTALDSIMAGPNVCVWLKRLSPLAKTQSLCELREGRTLDNSTLAANNSQTENAPLYTRICACELGTHTLLAHGP